jgi:intracellular sulfur oxidation DsrE/DsrF family protein
MTSILNSPVQAKAIMGPVLENYGPVYQVPELDEPLPRDFHYKAVFDVYKTASQNDVYSRRLESVARFINMHTLRGVPLEKIDLAVVIHGKAVKDILVDEKYQQKYGSPNPNKELIQALAEAGVKFYVCGQTVDFLNYRRSEILPEIKIALSAMTQLVYFQAEGYALLP